MAMRIQIDFDGRFYDVGEVEDTVDEFKEVARVDITHREGGAVVTVEGSEEDVAVIAGTLSNIALARTIEVRS
jgi:hypothetical protein